MSYVDYPRSSDQLVIRKERDSGSLVLALVGELDLASAPQLEHELTDAEAAGEDHIVIDLGGLEFMDSTGLHLLLNARERSAENGHRLSLLRGRRAIQRVFELTHTSTLFDFGG